MLGETIAAMNVSFSHNSDDPHSLTMAKKRKTPQSAEDNGDVAAPASKRKAPMPGDGAADNTNDRKTDAAVPQEKVLILCSRGITYRCVVQSTNNSSRMPPLGTDT